MRPGSVIVDIWQPNAAALPARRGSCTMGCILGPTNLPATVPQDAARCSPATLVAFPHADAQGRRAARCGSTRATGDRGNAAGPRGKPWPHADEPMHPPAPETSSASTSTASSPTIGIAIDDHGDRDEAVPCDGAGGCGSGGPRLRVAVITGRRAASCASRMGERGIRHIVRGTGNRRRRSAKLLEQLETKASRRRRWFRRRPSGPSGAPASAATR